MQDSLMLYKLIVLYMLGQVDFPLTRVQIFNFILDKGYATYFTLQQAVAELMDADLIRGQSTRNSTQLTMTDSGRETLSYFGNRVPDAIKQQIKHFFDENNLAMRNEVSIQADYYKTTSGDFAAHMSVKDNNEPIIELTLTVPTEEGAVSLCDNWLKKNQDIYAYVIKQLM